MAEQKFEVNKIYNKDISVETPNSPEMFKKSWEPTVSLNIGNSAKKIDEDDNFEVELLITVTATLEEKTAFLIEVKQAGIFTISGFDEAQQGYLIGATAPNVLFPYAREVISSLTQKAGFMPLLLNPINFDALYQQHVARLNEEANANNSDANAEGDADKAETEETKH